MHVGESVKAARIAAGLTLPDVRIATGLVEEELVAIESGQISVSDEDISALAVALETDVRVLRRDDQRD